MKLYRDFAEDRFIISVSLDELQCLRNALEFIEGEGCVRGGMESMNIKMMEQIDKVPEIEGLRP